MSDTAFIEAQADTDTADAPPRRTRATNSAQKAERRQRILDAAAELAAAHGYTDIAMSDVANKAGVAKGTLYLYFPTREALFLDLLRLRLAAFFSRLAARLDGAAPLDGPAALAGELTAELASDDLFTALVAILHTELEHNIDAERAAAFKVELRDQVLAGGAVIERTAPFVPAGSGALALLQTHALLIGYAHMAKPAPVILPLLEREDMAVFRIGFQDGLQPALTNLLRGLAAEPAAGAAAGE